MESIQARLESLQAEVNRSARLASLGLLAGTLAHEFSNLLTPLAAYARMAKADPGDRELTAKALDHAIDATERCNDIAENVLSLIKGESSRGSSPNGPRSASGDMSQRVRGADVQQAIDRAVASLIRAPEKDGISLRVHQECDGATVAVESTQLIQVVLNLLLNAKKAIGGSRGVISIHVARHEGEPKLPTDGLCLCSTWNNQTNTNQHTNTPHSPNKSQSTARSVVVIRVANTGPVVDAAQIAGQVAGQIDEADGLPSARQWGGRGLGLFICARIVRQAGGELWARCPREGGAEFTVVLPAAQSRAGGRAAA